jgi:hypothetical protein
MAAATLSALVWVQVWSSRIAADSPCALRYLSATAPVKTLEPNSASNVWVDIIRAGPRASADAFRAACLHTNVAPGPTSPWGVRGFCVRAYRKSNPECSSRTLDRCTILIRTSCHRARIKGAEGARDAPERGQHDCLWFLSPTIPPSREIV